MKQAAAPALKPDEVVAEARLGSCRCSLDHERRGDGAKKTLPSSRPSAGEVADMPQ